MHYIAHWDDCSVPFRVNDSALRDRAERFLCIELTPASKAQTGRSTIDIQRDDRGWSFGTPSGTWLIEHEDDAAFSFFELLAQAFGSAVRWPVVHAGGFVVDGGAILYLAELGGGKSRHTFAAWCEGYRILGDDRIALLLDEPAVKPLPKCLKLRLGDHDVPPAWLSRVPEDDAYVGNLNGDRRWILSRRLPGVADCEAAVPLRAVVMLRRTATGPTHIDEIPLLDALQELIPYTTFGDATPMDVLRFLKPHAPGDRMRRLNVAPEEIEKGLSLLTKL